MLSIGSFKLVTPYDLVDLCIWSGSTMLSVDTKSLPNLLSYSNNNKILRNVAWRVLLFRILTKVFYTYGSNWVILAWPGLELPRGRASDWHTDGQTDAGNDKTRWPYWPRVKNEWAV